MKRGTGWLKDDTDPRDFGTVDMVRRRAVQSVPRTNLLRYRGPVLEQGPVNACVGFALARTIQMSLAIQGDKDPPLPSPLWNYWIARKQQYAGLDLNLIPPLEDKGCFPRLAMKAVKKMGFVREEDFPFMVENSNLAPGPAVCAEAYSQKGFEYYRINETGEARVEAVEHALKCGFPVLFGMVVDEAFTEHFGRKAIASIDQNNTVGGHMMAVLGITESSVLIDNWWGRGWGCDGEGWAYMTQDLFGNATDDCFAIVATPDYTAGGAL